jgi:integrase
MQPSFVPYIYSTDDIRRLLAVPDSHYPGTSPLLPDTMRTFILVLYGTGLRLGEVSRLTHADADLKNGTLLIRERNSANRDWLRSGRSLSASSDFTECAIVRVSVTNAHRHSSPAR